VQLFIQCGSDKTDKRAAGNERDKKKGKIHKIPRLPLLASYYSAGGIQ
jgi:hypothetical protein